MTEQTESFQTRTPKRLYIRTFGCQMNERDSETLTTLLGARGYETTTRPELADLVLLNTCSVREGAEHKLWSVLGELRSLKRAHPKLIVAVGGCVAQQHGPRLLDRSPCVDVVFGTSALTRLPELVESIEASGGRIAETTRSKDWAQVSDEAEPESQGASAYVTIQRGCSRRCGFCIVPETRGPEINRPSVAVLEEARRRAMRGAKEVTLLGQNITAYRWRDEQGGAWRLAELLRAVAAVPGIVRLRFLTAHPAGVDLDLIRALVEVPSLCSHVHLPVQSGSDRVLKAMGRGHRRSAYLETTRRLRETRPGLSITTDLIVGFPGETEADFGDTLSLVKEAAFDGAYCFKYSPRPGTKAFALGDPVPGEEKARRLAGLQDLCGLCERRSNEAMLGRDETILVEGPSKDGKGISGRTDSHKVVNVEGGSLELTGRLVRVRIHRAFAHSLGGALVGTAGLDEADPTGYEPSRAG